MSMSSSGALSALNRCRAAVAGTDSLELDYSVRALAVALGSTRPQRSTVSAIAAVVAKIEQPEIYPRDKDAWTAYGAWRLACAAGGAVAARVAGGGSS